MNTIYLGFAYSGFAQNHGTDGYTLQFCFCTLGSSDLYASENGKVYVIFDLKYQAYFGKYQGWKLKSHKALGKIFEII